MVENNSSVESTRLSTLLQELYRQKADVDITVTSPSREGTIHVRNGIVLSAHSGILHGNGAILTLALLSDTEIKSVSASETVQKTVFLSQQQLERFLLTQKPSAQSAATGHLDEEQQLAKAKNLFFLFRYKEAVDILVSILRRNRFFYPAWLWQSRILTRQDYISKALDEAYRWGNHDQDVWREARKMRPQLVASDTQVKRCIYCWSILPQNGGCSHCKATFAISSSPPSKDLRQEELRFALTCFEQAHQNDKNNSRVAFTLALGHFNLGELAKAKEYLESACQRSPMTPLYDRSLSVLTALQRRSATTSPPPPVQPVPTAPAAVAPVAEVSVTADRPSILMVEDSMTSRKVLSMLFKRYGYHLLEAASGSQALELAASHRPQLMLLDVMLPDTSGHELLAKLRHLPHFQDVPVIMLTGKHDAKDRLKGIQGGAQEYITKPFDPQKLTALVRSYLNGSASAADGVTPDTPSTRVDQASPAAVPAPAGPTISAPSAIMPPSTGTSPVSPPAGKSNGKSIFIIEDSRTSRKVLTMLLNRHGYTLYEAATGQEALTIAPTIRPDLVLLDVMLPDMTGYTILPQLKELPHFADLPFIMLTGNRKATDRMQGMLAGTNEYLTKPFDPQKLLTVIGSYL
jgi:DNA-binding response OmpR family regulator